MSISDTDVSAEFCKSIFEHAEGLQREANRLGINTTQLQAYQCAARASGVETETADVALRRFIANMGALQDGTGPAVKAIQYLGLTADELAVDPTAALTLVAQKLDGVTGGCSADR